MRQFFCNVGGCKTQGLIERATPGRFTWKVEGEKFCKSQFFKVTNKGKPAQTFSLACNLTKNDVGFLAIDISSKKVRAINVDFSIIKVTSKKLSENNVDFWTIQITPKKVRGNDVYFLIREITSKKYVEMTWKFVEIWSSTYWCNIHVESTSIWRSVSVG